VVLLLLIGILKHEPPEKTPGGQGRVPQSSKPTSPAPPGGGGSTGGRGRGGDQGGEVREGGREDKNVAASRGLAHRSIGLNSVGATGQENK
jgi:hypothetical protein